jgi:hypothetical protein
MVVRLSSGWGPKHFSTCAFTDNFSSLVGIYRHTSFHCASGISPPLFFVYKLKVCGNPASSKSIGAIVSTACAHFVSLYHILVILAIFQTFSLLLLYLFWWSVISDVTIVIVLGRHEPRPYKTANLIDKCCVFWKEELIDSANFIVILF